MKTKAVTADSIFGGRMPSGDVHIVVDWKNFVHRAAHVRSGMPPGQDLQTSDGRVSGHIFRGFKMLHALRRAYGGILVFAFEGVDNFRYKLYPDYKGNRASRKLMKLGSVIDGTPGPLPSDFDPEPDMVKLISHMKCVLLTPHGGEADDAIATFVKHTPGRHVVISTDRDLWYLLKYPNVEILGFQREAITKDTVKEEFGVSPNRVPLYKALFGDPGDNILNVPRLGPKSLDSSLRKLISSSKNTTKFLASVKKSTTLSPKVQKLILAYSKQIKLMYKIARLRLDVPTKRADLTGNAGNLRAFLQHYECKSLYDKAIDLTT